jgi:putative AlgH/UPF0301 family transcriptional regulator
LESVRAFIYDKKNNKNDIIILFRMQRTRFKRAALFVTQHKWAKEIGLVLNFEARGSSTKLYVNGNQQGNAALVKSLLLQKRLLFSIP